MNGLFRALDDPTRRRILDLLGQRDLPAGEIAREFALGKPTVSHHLALLRRAGLVSSRKVGQSVVYRLEATVLDECLSWFLNLVALAKKQRRSTHEKSPATSPPRKSPTHRSGSPLPTGRGAVG